MPKKFWPAGDYWPLKVSTLKVNLFYELIKSKVSVYKM